MDSSRLPSTNGAPELGPEDAPDQNPPATGTFMQRLRASRDALPLTVLVLALAAGYILTPFWPSLLLAAWVAMLVRPIYERLSRFTGGRSSAAALATVTLLVALLLPVVLVTASLATEAIELINRLQQSKSGHAALKAIVSNGDHSALSLESFDAQRAIELVETHGASAWTTLKTIAGATVTIVLGLFIFVVATYTFLLRGKQFYTWFLRRSPLSREHTRRFAAAFKETGRGLFIGVGLTAVLQGLAAGVGYFAIGLPKAGVLTVLTILCAFVPSLGAAIVWAPVAGALFISGEPWKALAMGLVGAFVSTADNFVRPALSRYGQLRLPMFVVLVSMLGGVVLLGPWGLLLGPLVIRLAVEGLGMLSTPTITRVTS